MTGARVPLNNKGNPIKTSTTAQALHTERLAVITSMQHHGVTPTATLVDLVAQIIIGMKGA